jgi:hypothetical protein
MTHACWEGKLAGDQSATAGGFDGGDDNELSEKMPCKCLYSLQALKSQYI